MFAFVITDFLAIPLALMSHARLGAVLSHAFTPGVEGGFGSTSAAGHSDRRDRRSRHADDRRGRHAGELVRVRGRVPQVALVAPWHRPRRRVAQQLGGDGGARCRDRADPGRTTWHDHNGGPGARRGRAAEVETVYQLQATTRDKKEAHVRALLLQTVAGHGYQLRALRSADIDGTDRVEVNAELAILGRYDEQIEAAAGRLGLEPNVTSVRWHVAEPDSSLTRHEE